MNILSLLACSVLAAAACGAHAAAPTFSSGGMAVPNAGLMSLVVGATTIDFDSGLAPGNYSGGMVFAIDHPGYAAQPPLDLTPFYSVGVTDGQTTPGTAVFGGLSYFGFYMGSADEYNTVVFYGADNSTFTLTGAAMASLASVSPNGDQSVGFYVNAWAGAGAAFTQIEFHSPTNAFETDNHAYINAVPEPQSYAMLLAGLGLLAWLGRRRA
jgi:hypothetical protein